MRISFEAPEALRTVSRSIQSVVAALSLSSISTGQTETIPVDTRLSAEQLRQILLVEDGEIQCWYYGRQLVAYEKGDMIWLGASPEFGTHFELKCDLAAEIRRYDPDTVFAALRADSVLSGIWDMAIGQMLLYFKIAAASLLPKAAPLNPEFRYFDAGETIVRENEPGDEILTLSDGEAEVSVNGVVVGEICADEIFGAIAALTGTARTATVIARTPCMVFAVPKDDFLELVKNRPSLIEKLVSGMAKTIVSLNRRIVAEQPDDDRELQSKISSAEES